MTARIGIVGIGWWATQMHIQTLPSASVKFAPALMRIAVATGAAGGAGATGTIAATGAVSVMVAAVGFAQHCLSEAQPDRMTVVSIGTNRMRIVFERQGLVVICFWVCCFFRA